MTDQVSIRPPARDWRWWVALVVLTAVSLGIGWALFNAGLDTGVAGTIAALPMVAFVFLTYFWRKRALSSM